jgi:GT2 family glycosyltransferase
MSESKVGILILYYNRYEDTVACVNSILNIDYNNYKIILVDNCSNDGSFEKIKKELKGIEILQTGSNLGFTGGINYGIKYLLKQNYDYILTINNDTIVEKDFLSILVEAMENEPEAVAACGTILNEHDREKIWYASGKIVGWRGLAVHLNKGKKFIPSSKVEYVTFITGCLMLLRASSIEKIGLLDEKFFMYLDDIEYSQRIINKKFKLLYVPGCIIYHKVFGEKESAFKLYYSVRNRLLLISTAFNKITGFIASVYFLLVITLKIIYWLYSNPVFAKAAIAGLSDYIKKNFGQGHGNLFYSKAG